MTERTPRARPDASCAIAVGSSRTRWIWLPSCWTKLLRGMLFRGMLFWSTFFRTAIFWTGLASAQVGAPDAGARGDCTRSREPHECAERCPSFDTCYVEEDEQLYYRVMSERFECSGLDCNAASVQLADYCCRRGEYAPSRGDGGCALTPASPPGRTWLGERFGTPGVCAAALGAALSFAIRRGRRCTDRGAPRR